MAVVVRRHRWPVAAAACVILGGSFVATKVLRADPDPATKPVVVGAQNCVYCHETSKPVAPQDKQGVARFDEMVCWMAEDRHAKAFAALGSPLGRDMSERLYGDPLAAEKKNECLSCHGVPSTVTVLGYDAKREGVTCTVCHGESEEWIRRHWLDADWRTKRTDERKFGMVDLANPVIRATSCASCHIGDVSDDRVVTHRMYAAGHPPLPPFEAVAYADRMPPHWNEIADPALRKERGLADPTISAARSALLGIAASFRASFELLAASAEQSLHPQSQDQRWPRFEQLDCYACHHDLRVSSWRQKREDLDESPKSDEQWKPGRPRPREWEMTFMNVISQWTGDAALEEEFDRLRDELYSTFNRQPFGNPKSVAACSSAIVEWSNKLIARLQSMPVDPESLRGLLVGLCEVGQDGRLDKDAVRQLSWLVETVAPTALPNEPTLAPMLAELSQLCSLDFKRSIKQWISESRLNEDLESRDAFEDAALEDGSEPARVRQIFGSIEKLARSSR